MKNVIVKVPTHFISLEAMEDAGINPPHDGKILLWEDGSTTFRNGVPTNEAVTKASYAATGFKFWENDHPSGLACLGSPADNSRIFG